MRRPVSIYTIAYNEELVLPQFIRWYRSRLPDCRIVVYDNESTDGTRQAALDNDCDVFTYSTGNSLSDGVFLRIKNSCWKDADTDWVMVVDCDEFVDVDGDDIGGFEDDKKTIVSGVGYNMCNVEGVSELAEMRFGIRGLLYDKPILFNKGFIREMNYNPGCHGCNPEGVVNYGVGLVDLYHMLYVDEDLLVAKYLRNAGRLCEENIKRGWSIHYLKSEKEVRSNYRSALERAVLVR